LPPVEPIQDVGAHVHRIHYLTHFLSLRGEPMSRIDGRSGTRQNHARIARAPAAVVERAPEIAGLRDPGGIAAQSRHRAAPAVRHNDRRQLSACHRFQRIHFAGHATALAQDVHLSLRNVVRQDKRYRLALLPESAAGSQGRYPKEISHFFTLTSRKYTVSLGLWFCSPM